MLLLMVIFRCSSLTTDVTIVYKEKINSSTEEFIYIQVTFEFSDKLILKSLKNVPTILTNLLLEKCLAS